nr:acetamidase/formamidase family protein [Candidatus Baldrarchaeota archaeon]
MEIVRKIDKKPYDRLSHVSNCTFGPLNEPMAWVKPKEIVEIETHDRFGDIVKIGKELKEIVKEGLLRFVNPVTGPIYIEEAKPGDTLIVEILDIRIPEIGVTTASPDSGALKGLVEISEIKTKFLKIRKGKVVYETSKGSKVEIPVKPFIGTIGVSPEIETISTTTPGRHGGNMDCPDICPGNKLYLPVFREGALFSLGNVHAVQGDGKICGTSLEVPAHIKLKFDLIRDKKVNWPRVESPEEIMTICSDKPLEDAAKLAFMELIKWMKSDYNFWEIDAYILLSLAAKLNIAQIVNPLYTVIAKISKQYLQ